MKNIPKKRIAISLVVLVIILFLIFLQTNREVSIEPIKIGYLGPLTGDAASVGEAGVPGAELAIKEINERGGVLGRSLELIIEDDGCSAETGVNATTKLISVDKVVAISGPDCGSVGGSALPIAQRNKVPVVIRWASVPNLPHIGDYIFRIFPSDNLQGKFSAEYIYNTLGLKKVALLYVQNDYGKGLEEVFTREFTSLGGEIVYTAGFDQEATDLRSILTKVKQANSEAIYFPAYRISGPVGLKQIKEMGITVPVVAGDAFDADEVINNPVAEGVLFPRARTNNPDDFKEKIQEFTGKEINHVATPLAYDSIMIIAQAIEEAGTTRGSAIQQALESTDYTGESSERIQFDSEGDFIGGEYDMVIIQGGKVIPYVYEE